MCEVDGFKGIWTSHEDLVMGNWGIYQMSTFLQAQKWNEQKTQKDLSTKEVETLGSPLGLFSRLAKPLLEN